MARDTAHDDAICDIWSAYLTLTDVTNALPSRQAAIEELADIIADNDDMREATARLMMRFSRVHDSDHYTMNRACADQASADQAVAHSNLLYGRPEQVREYIASTGDAFLLRLQSAYGRIARKPISEHDLDMIEDEARELYDAGTSDAA